MSIGGGIALIVIGAILAFALNIQLSWIDLRLVGDILMVAGVVIIIIGLIMMFRRRQISQTTRSNIDPATGERITRRTTDDDRL